MNRKVISVRKYKVGYVVNTELVSLEGDDESVVMKKSAYTLSGAYIGNSVLAHRLIVQRGIMPELRSPKHGVCSIGFSEAEQKWYGWSHRALYGFEVGSVAKKGDVVTMPSLTEEYLKEHPEEDKSLSIGFEAKTLDDAKLMAIAFAEGVS